MDNAAKERAFCALRSRLELSAHRARDSIEVFMERVELECAATVRGAFAEGARASQDAALEIARLNDLVNDMGIEADALRADVAALSDELDTLNADAKELNKANDVLDALLSGARETVTNALSLVVPTAGFFLDAPFKIQFLGRGTLTFSDARDTEDFVRMLTILKGVADG